MTATATREPGQALRAPEPCDGTARDWTANPLTIEVHVPDNWTPALTLEIAELMSKSRRDSRS